MSILINMAMPKNCGECPIYEHLSIHENTFRFCRLTRMETNPIERRDDCPLIEVPFEEPDCETVVIKTPMPKFMRETEGENE